MGACWTSHCITVDGNDLILADIVSDRLKYPVHCCI